jgi:CMP-N,N'-diacetyllegionaminic acid synthase
MKKKLSIVALIPARSGSKRIKDKNIKLFNGHPLIAYTISSAFNSKVFNDVIVSTDSEKYKNIAEHYGASVLLRPKEISGDNSPDIQWVRHAMDQLKKKGKEYELFSILRPTSPFRKSKTILRALDVFYKSKNSDSLRAVEICSQHPAKMWYNVDNSIQPVLVGDNNGVPWHSCQYSSLPEIYVQNASLEIAKTSMMYKSNSISGKNIIPFITIDSEGYDINKEKDWVYAQYLTRKNKQIFPNINIEHYRNLKK